MAKASLTGRQGQIRKTAPKNDFYSGRVQRIREAAFSGPVMLIVELGIHACCCNILCIRTFAGTTQPGPFPILAFLKVKVYDKYLKPNF